MSERIFSVLLRLYPSGFRKHYEQEYIQLLRDRFHYEIGFRQRARLICDLLADLLSALPSAYQNSYIRPQATLAVAGDPSLFKLLDIEPMQRFSLAFGSAISLAIVSAFLFGLQQRIDISDKQTSPVLSVMQRLNKASTSEQGKELRSNAPNTSPNPVDDADPVAAIDQDKQSVPSKLAFEVASIRPSEKGKLTPPNFALDKSDSYAPFPDPHGSFIANFPLWVYIQFAYKLSLTSEQSDAILARLPKWVATDPFEIRAKTEGNPTKEQMRLMLQALLADRFKLAIRFETKQLPALALTLEQSGKTGPALHPHREGPACEEASPAAISGPAATAGKCIPSHLRSFHARTGRKP